MKFRQLLFVTLSTALLSAQTYIFSEAGSRARYSLATDELYIKTTQGALPPSGARKLSTNAYLMSIPGASRKVLRERGIEIGGSPLYSTAAPVFYGAGEKRSVANMRIATAKILVKGPAPEGEPATAKPSLLAGWTLLTYASPWAALDAVDRLNGRVELMPVFARQQSKRQSLERPVNDPLYLRQWHFTDSEANLNLRATWDNFTGRGVNMVIVDDGVDVNHEDLRDNAYPISSNYHANVKEGPDNDPTPPAEDNHGTGAAGLAVGRGFNGLGIVGVAPETRFMAIRMIGAEVDDETEGNAFAYQPEGVITHVSSNSWGPDDNAETLGKPGPLTVAGLEAAATKNRDGLGTVVVISAGNGRREGDDSGYDAYSSSRFAISVGAVNKKMEQSSYSESGMAVAISAFGGELAPPEMLWTTNNMGDASLALLKQNFETTQAPVNYSDAYNGTSGAAPQVSGAAALLLQANPRLGYRDVKEILMRTARRTGLAGGDPFVTNRAGISFSHSFGAGLMDVSAAVAMAQTWTNLGPLVSIEGNASGLPLAIPDASDAGATVEFQAPSSNTLRVEHVELVVDIEHSNRGDLGFAIISPSGMISVAEPRQADEAENIENFTFTSVRNWGEPSNGVWQVKVLDTAAGDRGVIRAMKLRIFGTQQ